MYYDLEVGDGQNSSQGSSRNIYSRMCLSDEKASLKFNSGIHIQKKPFFMVDLGPTLYKVCVASTNFSCFLFKAHFFLFLTTSRHGNHWE